MLKVPHWKFYDQCFNLFFVQTKYKWSQNRMNMKSNLIDMLISNWHLKIIEI